MMVGRIVAFVSCLMCAVPFLIIAVYNKDSREPINFGSGDTSLKEKVKHVQEYNKEMALLYKRSGVTFLLTGVVFLVLPLAGIVLLCLECTVGIYLVYRSYKSILRKYS